MIDLARRGHYVGGGMISENKEYFYLSIPKNGSSFTNKVLGDNKWLPWNINRGEYNTAIIILRDPLERWVTGFATYVASWVLQEDYHMSKFVAEYNDILERFIFDNLVFDDHTAPQSLFINNLPDVNKVYIKLNGGNLIQTLSSLTNQVLTVVPDSVNFSNTKESNILTNGVSEFMSARLTPVLIEKIKQMYKDDYDLINQAKFYDPR